MVKISIQHGTSGAAAHAYGDWGCVLGHVFNNYPEADRFGKLACDLIEKYDFIAHRAEVHYAMASIALFVIPSQLQLVTSERLSARESRREIWALPVMANIKP
jgi:hypothetical protein